jgi:hypothetical protein
MAAGTYNISIEKRATFSITLTIKNSDGSAYDLSNASLSSQIRIDSSNAPQPYFTIAIVGDPTSGVATLSLTKNQTSALSIAPSSYDLFVDKSDGTSEKLLQGSVTIIENETALSDDPIPIADTYTPRKNVDFFNSSLISSSASQYNYIDTETFSGIDVVGLNAVFADQDCRVRLYNSIDYSDLSRPSSEDPANGAGLVTEVILTSGETVYFTPSLIGSVNNTTNSGQSMMVAISTTSAQTEGSISGHFDILQFL